MSRPRVLIPTPTSFDEPYNAQSWPEYANAITEFGGEAIQLPLIHAPAELRALVSQADAILLPGSGADIDPERYGHPREETCNRSDKQREDTDRALFEAAEATGKPLLGICFGTQSMNVHYGGTLSQDLRPVPINHRAGRSVIVAHSILVVNDSRLGRILATSEEPQAIDTQNAKLQVNSSHHQAIAALGDRLRIVARSPEDGVIEAIEGSDPERFLLGVQWHPERTRQTSAASRAIFHAFLQAAKA